MRSPSSRRSPEADAVAVTSFRLSSEPIDPAFLSAALRDTRAGACATFEGWVRDHSEGRSVHALDYEAYPKLAEKEGEQLLAEALIRFPILAASCVHRTGSLALGDLAVW